MSCLFLSTCFSVVNMGREYICYLLYMWENSLFVICVPHSVATLCCVFSNVCCPETVLQRREVAVMSGCSLEKLHLGWQLGIKRSKLGHSDALHVSQQSNVLFLFFLRTLFCVIQSVLHCVHLSSSSLTGAPGLQNAPQPSKDQAAAARVGA